MSQHNRQNSFSQASSSGGDRRPSLSITQMPYLGNAAAADGSSNRTVVVPDTYPSPGDDYLAGYANPNTSALLSGQQYSPSSASPSPTPSPLTRIEVDPYDVLAAALVPGALQRNDFRPEKKRWYVLLVFSWLSAMQGLVWCTFSTVPESSNNYFGEPSKSQNFIDLILNWSDERQRERTREQTANVERIREEQEKCGENERYAR